MIAVAALAAAAALSGCSKRDEAPPEPVTAGNVKLTAAQRQSVRLYTVQSSIFHDTVETTGVVDFDNDQATSVLSPISGPVSRLLVSLGQRVKKGEPLATVDSPGLCGGHQLLIRRRSPRPRPTATWPTSTRISSSTTESLRRKRRRPKPTQPTPKRTETRRYRNSFR